MDFPSDSGQGVFGLVVVEEAELDLAVSHGRYEFAFFVEHSQVNHNHNQENNKNDPIGIELVDESLDVECGGYFENER